MSIKVNISASTTKIKKSFSSLKGMAKNAGRSIVSAFSGMGAKIAAMLTVGAVIAVVKNVTAKLDALKKSADNLNMNTDEFQKFSLAAQLAGSSAKEFETGAINMVRNLGMALDGQQTAIDRFTKLGLDPEQLRGKEVHEQLGMVYDALNSVEDSTVKTSLAMELFGRAGKRVNGLASDWRNLTDAVKDKLISEQQLKDAEAYNDAMLQLQSTFSKLVIGSGLIQFLTKVGLKLDEIFNKKPVSTIPIKPLKDWDESDYATPSHPDEIKARNERRAKEKSEAEKPKKPVETPEQIQAKRTQDNLDFARQRATKALNANESEQEQINRAKSVQDVYDIEKEITKQRVEQLKLNDATTAVQDKIKEYEQEFKWQQMILKGQEKQVEVEKALAEQRKTAKRDLTEAERLATTRAVATLFDINAKDKDPFTNPINPVMDFKGDSVLSMGGILGNQAQVDSARDAILKAQQKSLINLERSVMSLDNKMRSRHEQNPARWI